MICYQCGVKKEIESDLVEFGEIRLCLKCYIKYKVKKGDWARIKKEGEL
jgi:hypothetical protein